MNRYIFLFSLFLFVNSLCAQDTLSTDTLQLEEVIISYKADWTTPLSFINLYSDQLNAKSTGQEPSFILSQTPSITAYSEAGNTQGYSYIRLRGIDQTRINFTLDGVPLNEPEDQGAYFSNYPDILNSVSRIQVQRGVGTSKNGVASYAGSIELFSPNLYDSAKTTFGAGYGSFNSYRMFGEYNSGMKQGKALYARASQIHSDGYKYHSSNDSRSIFLSSGLYRDKTIWKMNLMIGHQKNRLAWLGVSDSLIRLDRRTNVNENERDNFTQCLAQLQNKWFLSGNSSLQSGLYYTFLKGNYDFNLNSFLGLPSTNELYNYALQSHLAGLFSNYTYSGKNLVWTTGVHGNIYNRRHTGSEKTLGRLYRNTGYKNEASVFSKVTYTFKNVNLFADVQYRHSSFSYAGTVAMDNIQWNFINPKAGVSIAIHRDLLLYYIIGKSGREPTRTDMFGGNDNLLADSSGRALLTSTSPEYVVDQELGLRRQGRKMSVGFNLYYMRFRNEFVLNGKFGPNSLPLTSSVDKSIRTGAELSLQWRLSKHLQVVNNSSYNYSVIREQEASFTPVLTPRVIINQEAVYSFKKVALALEGRYQSNSFIDFANTAKIADYVLVNARIQYTLQRLQLTGYVYNLTNSKYYNNGFVDSDGSRKYFVQAPVNYYISVGYSF